MSTSRSRSYDATSNRWKFGRCVVPCAPHKIGNTVVWYGTTNPYQKYWPLVCFSGPDYGCLLVTYSLIVVPSTLICIFILPSLHVVAMGIGIATFAGTTLALTCAGCSDPGIVPRRMGDDPSEIPSVSRRPSGSYCGQCNVTRPVGAVHCYDCNCCVMGLDHHCPWTGKCIGERNLRFFYGFLTFLCLHILSTVVNMAMWMMTAPQLSIAARRNSTY